jgi:hypothetical protein
VIYQAANLTKLHYAGDGMWSYEEDAYNPDAMATVVKAWLARKRELKSR